LEENAVLAAEQAAADAEERQAQLLEQAAAAEQEQLEADEALTAFKKEE
jgi:hypothetical protein